MKNSLINIVFVVVFINCNPELKITADPKEIKANGISKSRITVELDAEDGTQVDFYTDLGHFLDNYGNQTDYVTKYLANGTTYVDLISDVIPGEATVTVNYTTPQGIYGTGTIKVKFYLPKVSGNRINFQCDRVNIGALRESVSNISVKCYVTLYDKDGDPVSIKSFSKDEYGFEAEAGSFDPNYYEDYDGRIYFLYRSFGGENEPKDTEPIQGEPSQPDPLGLRSTRNPRDGLVTLVFYIKGEEGFDDLNGNGVLDSNEYFYDFGEPFLDVDDDGIFDPLKGDRLLKDIDQNGDYTGPNGKYDEDTYVWAVYKILWTGDPKKDTIKIESNSGGFDIGYNQTLNFELQVNDINLNPIAGTSEDYIQLIVNCGDGYYCEYQPDSWYLSDSRGFDIDEEGKILGNLFTPIIFRFSIKNTNYTENDEFYSIGLLIYSSPGPDQYGDCCMEQDIYDFSDLVRGRLIAGGNSE